MNRITLQPYSGSAETHRRQRGSLPMSHFNPAQVPLKNPAAVQEFIVTQLQPYSGPPETVSSATTVWLNNASTLLGSFCNDVDADEVPLHLTFQPYSSPSGTLRVGSWPRSTPVLQPYLGSPETRSVMCDRRLAAPASTQLMCF